MRVTFLRISSADYRKTLQFLKAEKSKRNSVIMTGKYNKEYRLRVARRFCMYIGLSCSHQWRRVVRLEFTARQIQLRNHWDELKNSVSDPRENISVLNLYFASNSHTGE